MNIYGQTMEKLRDYFLSFGDNPAKAKLVFKALYEDKISSFLDIESLSAPIKTRLCADFGLALPTLLAKTESEDTSKFLFRLSDGLTVETVLMRHDYGNGVCVSTQVGCNMDCVFCESGKLKKVRNLDAAEMVGQVLYIRDVLQYSVSHVVLMGIGEPFDNYDAVMDFVDIITAQPGMAIASRHVTISTCGITPRLLQYAERSSLNSLAISLHAPNDALRNKLMPINRRYPLGELVEAAGRYTRNSRRKVTFAYIMLKGINDSLACAEELAALLSGLSCYVNLIPYNKTRSGGFEPSDKAQIAAFYDVLKQRGLNVTVRREFGSDMNAACGQLSSDYNNDRQKTV